MTTTNQPATYPGLSVHKGDHGYFVAHGYRKLEHADPETFRITPFYPNAERAGRAYHEKAAEYAEHVKGYILDILRRDNVTEPSGQWSAYDVARILDPAAREPRHMFDTGPETVPAAEWVALAERTIKALDVGGRYVGGTSGHLYSL
jgi:hypothetical protein